MPDKHSEQQRIRYKKCVVADTEIIDIVAGQSKSNSSPLELGDVLNYSRQIHRTNFVMMQLGLLLFNGS